MHLNRFCLILQNKIRNTTDDSDIQYLHPLVYQERHTIYSDFLLKTLNS